MTDTPATIPQSSALAEASGDSLSELFSRDPEGFQRQDLDRIIAVLRAKRAVWQANEHAEGAGKPKRKSAAEMLAKTASKAEDLGL